MEEQVSHLVSKIWEKYQLVPSERRLLIAIGGIPGSGKTTIAQALVTALNAKHASTASSPDAPVAAFVPMDGYHLTRAQLSAMPDPERAHARRGAEFTFDGDAFLALVQSLRVPLKSTSVSGGGSEVSPTIYAPSFDHAVKDPVADAIPIAPTHRIVVFEGNYVVLDKEPWRTAATAMDERWFVQVDFETARRRLIKRHIASGIALDEAAADRRARENDLLNGEDIVRLRLHVDEVITSREDGAWVH